MNHGIRSYKKRVFEKPLAFTQFLLDFQSENGFELAKDRRIEMRGSHLSTAYFCFSHCLTPRPKFRLISTDDYLGAIKE